MRQPLEVLNHSPSAQAAQTALDQGNYQRALELARAAIAQNPNAAWPYICLGNAYLAIARTEGGGSGADSALRAYAIALNNRPERPLAAEAAARMAELFHTGGQWETAAEFYGRSLKADPQQPIICYNWAQLESDRLNWDRAAALALQAQTLDPALTPARFLLVDIYSRSGRFAEAIAFLQADLAAASRANSSVDEQVALWQSLACVYLRAARYAEAAECYEQAILLHKACANALEPGNARSQYHYAVPLWALGRWAEGWRQAEWRFELPEYEFLRRSMLERGGRIWQGEPLAGSLWIVAEGGFGDVLQLARFLPLVAARVARLVLQCNPALVSLLARLPGMNPACFWVTPQLPSNETPEAILALASLPHVLGIDLATIPGDPYLPQSMGLQQASANAVPSTQRRLGLVWASGNRQAGQRDYRLDAHDRSLSLEQLWQGLQPTIDHPDWVRISLQVGPAADQIATARLGASLVDQGASLRDFADTAAVVAHLDLVITVDTAVAHLAGGMGKPVWILLAFAADARWMIDPGADANAVGASLPEANRPWYSTPWYPTARLFRQRQPGNWSEVLSRVRSALAVWQME